MTEREVRDYGYRSENLSDGELKHAYGERVHILSDPYHLSLLAKLSSADTVQPEINHLVTTLYRDLIAAVVSREFPRISRSTETRMIEHTPDGVFTGEVIDPTTSVVAVDVARAGMLPAQVCFDALNHVLDPRGVRQDHLIMNRVTNEKGEVTGARIFGEKTGGDVGGRFVLFPDPMGATGSSLVKAIRYYQENQNGDPARIITMNLIVTPEFVQNLTKAFPRAIIYAFRLDRGLSDPDVLESPPGTYPDRERGLNDQHYIVPGAGGLGEVINNVFV
ncbi:MAG: uracil phosphoribosyltransferase [Deltaproteobacteria bacterium]|nr:uracil phosphoribosyltransferase [Deltaproteobacteria bacterium]